MGVQWFTDRSTALTISRLVANAVYSPLQVTHLRCCRAIIPNVMRQGRCSRHGVLALHRLRVSLQHGWLPWGFGTPLEWFSEGCRKIQAFSVESPPVYYCRVQTTGRMAVWGGQKTGNGTACLSRKWLETRITRIIMIPKLGDGFIEDCVWRFQSRRSISADLQPPCSVAAAGATFLFTMQNSYAGR